MTGERERIPPDEATRVHGATDDPEELRREIEETRAELGATVEALSEKADVKARITKKADERKQQAREKGEELGAKASELGDRLREATPDQAQAAASQTVEHARERPLPFAVGGALVLGFALGWLIQGR
jgi:ElaB/YqjD/DUF883 family membrane-anchored ribosome-binding protein